MEKEDKIIVMEEENKRFVEVYEILKQMSPESVMKIPEDIRNYIKDNRDEEYIWNYDKTKDFKNQNINEDTLVMLAYLNTEYMLDEKQKQLMKQIYKINQQKLEKEKGEKYNSDSLFKKSNNKEENRITEYKEGLFAKIKRMFKNLFKKS